MSDEEQQRLLGWEGCHNARDLGGYPTVDGGQTRWGAVVRMDNPAQLTAAGRRALIDHGIRTIVDLRKPEEIQHHPNPFAEPGPHGITYTNVSLVDPGVPSPEFTTLANDYKRILDTFPAEMALIMTGIAEAPEGGVLIHCMAGKDRTGITSALLLTLAGVPREIIAEDYGLTSECLRKPDHEWLETGPGEREWREEQQRIFRARPEVMREVLAHLDERYGGVEAYLRQAGVTGENIARVRRRMVSNHGDEWPGVRAEAGAARSGRFR